MKCDLCGKQPPKWRFNPRRPFLEFTLYGTVLVITDHDRPWDVCDGCKPCMQKGQLHLILQRAVRGMVDGRMLTKPELRAQRAKAKNFFRELLKAGLMPPVPLEPDDD
ncbi:hypothetical protein [Nonomuraea jabiensis]|uniref:hypothetical protein n=1 Tax=Nonomuraea jabiensis TaxID=882448 RepID=UPI003D75E530